MLSRSALVAVALASSTISPRFLARSAAPAPAAREGTIRLPRLFANGMVVQRDKPVTVWGWSDPKAVLSVNFRGRTARATATSDGKWKTTLPPGSAGGPFTLSVRSGREQVNVHGVFVGDVWVASGQSNMEFRLAQALNGAREIAAANDSLIRQFKVPNSWSNTPEDDLAGGSWSPADSQHAGAFSAVGYFFARELRKSVKVPIGLINTTWGGSNIETWISRSAQHLSDSAWSAIVRADEERVRSARDTLRARFGDLPTTDVGMVNGNAAWADPALDESGWREMPVPSYWENRYPSMDGVAWYRFAFDLGENETRNGATLVMSAIDDDDITWVNGVEVGRTVGYNVPRSYRIPASALRAGRNVLAVRVADGGGGGGINGSVELQLSDGGRRSLAGNWKFRVGAISFERDGQRTNKIPSVLYNKMLHPALSFPIKGVIWYQGESNANNAQQAKAYRDQFVTLIESWRRAWGSGRDTIPFLWVQLPNFGRPDTVPAAEPAWALQRESMTAALSLPRTGQAITIDVGDSADLHPPNKLDVGVRLARVARRVAYGQPIVASGPTYRAHSIRGDTVIVELDHLDGGLVTRSADGQVGDFAVAGADRKFYWANAKIVGNRVHVWSNRVTAPIAARYAWANNPHRVSLYNREQLPAAPFRTDRW